MKHHVKADNGKAICGQHKAKAFLDDETDFAEGIHGVELDTEKDVCIKCWYIMDVQMESTLGAESYNPIVAGPDM